MQIAVMHVGMDGWRDVYLKENAFGGERGLVPVHQLSGGLVDDLIWEVIHGPHLYDNACYQTCYHLATQVNT